MAGTTVLLADDGPQLPEDDNTTNVYLNDSLEAADAVRRAERLTKLGRWRDAARLLQATSASSGDNLIKTGPRSFVGVRGHINGMISAWPAEGMKTYRELFEGLAADKIETAAASRSLPEMLRLFDQYFCTDAAAKLADTIGQLAIEAGELTLARDVYQRVLRDHPDGAKHTYRYRAMVTLVSLIRGDDIGELDEAQAATQLRWMGEDRALSDIVDHVRRTFRQTQMAGTLSEWPTFGGDPERNRRTSSEVDELGLLWRFDLAQPPGRQQAAGETAAGETTKKRISGRSLTSQPIISGGSVIFQHYREVIALHRNTGVVAWRYHPDGEAAPSIDRIDDQPIGWDSPTVYDGRIYASLPGDIVPYYGYQSVQNPPLLACLDAVSGRLIWPLDPDAFADAHPEVSFDSTPIVHRDQLFIVGRRRRSFGFEDCYLYCFESSNGNLLWRTHLGSASTGTFGIRRGTNSIAALHNGVVFVCSNLGSIAAISTYTGDVAWLQLYARNSRSKSDESGWSGRSAVPWAFNPVIFSEGRLVFVPTDSPNVIIANAEDGSIRHEFARDKMGGLVTLLGIKQNLLYGAGKEASCYDLTERAAVWSAPLPSGSDMHGRGAWVDDRLMIPTRSGMSTFGILDGERRDAAWDPEGQGGNILATPNQIFIAGSGRISAYVQKATIWDSLRARMSATPMDPVPALELAEIALRGGETKEALIVLDEAIARTKEFTLPLRPELMRRFFDDLLMFVDVLASRSELDADLLNKLFRYAAQCPPDAAAHLSYRLRLAPLFESHDQPAMALRLYHQVLRDRSLRKAETRYAAGATSAGRAPAGELARSHIAQLIEDHGRSIYAPFEEEAARWLQSGTSANDESVLNRLVATFPNSLAAPRALIALGDLLAARNHLGAASEQFARAYHRYPNGVNRPLLIQKIVHALEQDDRRVDAYRWAAKGALEYAHVSLTQDGKATTFAQWKDRLADARSSVEPALAAVSLPLSKRETALATDAALLEPLFGNAPACDWSQFFLLAADGVQAFDARTGAKVWPAPVKTRLAPRLLIATKGLAVLATEYEMLAIDKATGQVRWSHEDYPPDVDGDDDWEDGRRIRTHSLQGQHLLSVRDDGRMTFVNMLTGDIVWQQTHRPVPAGSVQIDRRWVVYHAVQDNQVALCVLDATNGKWIDAYLTGETRSVEEVLIAPDGQLLLVTTRSITAFEPDTGVRRWQVVLVGHIRPASLQMDIDSLYFSDTGRDLQKIGLEDGRMIWRSEQIVPNSVDDLETFHRGGSIIATTGEAIVAVDSVNGLVLWEGSTQADVSFSHRSMTESYVLAVDTGGREERAEAQAYFYDHRKGSGLIPKNGGLLSLGEPTDVRRVLAVNGAIVLQDGTSIYYFGQD